MGRGVRRIGRVGAGGAGERAVLARGAEPRRAVRVPAHIGNGGYDAQHYDVTIDYDPARTSMDVERRHHARATQGLSEFSLDFVSYSPSRA